MLKDFSNHLRLVNETNDPPFESPQGGEQLVEPQSDLYSGRSFTPNRGNLRIPFYPSYPLV